jgi:hypothetical protein
LQHIKRPNEWSTGVAAKLSMRDTFHVSYHYNIAKDDNVDEDQKFYITFCGAVQAIYCAIA